MNWEPSWFGLLAAAFIAEVIGTMAGFGAATVLTPIAALFIDIKSALALVAVFHLFGNGSRLYFFGKQIDWKIWALFGATGIIFTFAGAHWANQLSSASVKLAFGLFLVIFVALTAARADQKALPKQRATLIAGGAVSGFIAGLIGTGGAIRSACLLAFNLPKESYLGTSAAIAICIDATRVPVYLTGGMVPQSMHGLMLALVPVAFSGSWLGQYWVGKISPGAFKRFVSGALFLMGLKLMWDGWAGAHG